MNQKAIISLFLGFTVFIGVLILFITMYIQEPTSTTPTNSEPSFPFIYLAIMAIAFGGVLLGIIIRLRR